MCRITAGVLVGAALAVVGPGAALAQGEQRVVVDCPEPALAAAIRAALPPRPAPETLFDAERLAAEAAGRAALVLRAEGYYGGQAAPEAGGDPLQARIRVTPGPRTVFAPPAVDLGDAALDPAAQAALDAALAGVAPGAPARAETVLATEAAAVAALQAAGHLEAKAGTRRVVVDHAAGAMTVTLALEPGPLVRLGAVKVAPQAGLDQGAAARFAPWTEGARATPEALDSLRRGLARTGAFRRVDTELGEAAGPDGARPVRLVLEPAPRRTIELGASWSTTEGFGADALWTGRNLGGRAETRSVSLTLAEQTQALGASLAVPNGLGRRTARFAAELAAEDLGPFRRTGLALSLAAEAEPRLTLGPYRATSFGVSLTADLYDEAAGVEQAVVASAFALARRDGTDDDVDPRRGVAASLRLEPSVSAGDAATAFLRAIAEARAYRSPGDGAFTFAARGRAGWVEPLLGGGDDLPLDRLFYAGGGGSVRGYAFNAIFPNARAEAALAPGGRGLLEASIEARWRSDGPWGAVAFIDAGTAFDDLDGAGAWRKGVGVGVRYDLGFAPLRLDLAAPLDRREGDDRLAVYVSLGHAF